ncbi:MAG: hypothetical protein KGO48_06215 [Alphaproteobacteria bacterium]|nr:hypothetical protein [Alphaproteobacteria bacterium]
MVSVLLEAVRERARVVFFVLFFAADDRRFDVRLLRDAAFVPVLDLLRALVLRFAPAVLAREDFARVPAVFARLLLALLRRVPAAFARPPAFVLRRIPPRDALAFRVVRRRAGCARMPGSDILIPASANSISRSPMSVISADWRFADPDFRAIAFSLNLPRQCKETPQA